MAGGALGGVIGAALRVLPHFKEEWIQTPFYANFLRHSRITGNWEATAAEKVYRRMCRTTSSPCAPVRVFSLPRQSASVAASIFLHMAATTKFER
jgi:hypothetical protein